MDGRLNREEMKLRFQTFPPVLCERGSKSSFFRVIVNSNFLSESNR